MEVSLLTIEPAYIATSVQVRSEDVEQRCIMDKPDVEESAMDIENERSLVATKVWLLKNK
ncbi:MAG: hypothetical protein RSA51_06985 [Niameybacter sp.]